MGPTTKAISVTGGVTFDGLRDHFRIQTLGLMAGGADYLVLACGLALAGLLLMRAQLVQQPGNSLRP